MVVATLSKKKKKFLIKFSLSKRQLTDNFGDKELWFIFLVLRMGERESLCNVVAPFIMTPHHTIVDMLQHQNINR